MALCAILAIFWELFGSQPNSRGRQKRWNFSDFDQKITKIGTFAAPLTTIRQCSLVDTFRGCPAACTPPASGWWWHARHGCTHHGQCTKDAHPVRDPVWTCTGHPSTPRVPHGSKMVKNGFSGSEDPCISGDLAGNGRKTVIFRPFLAISGQNRPFPGSKRVVSGGPGQKSVKNVSKSWFFQKLLTKSGPTRTAACRKCRTTLFGAGSGCRSRFFRKINKND